MLNQKNKQMKSIFRRIKEAFSKKEKPVVIANKVESQPFRLKKKGRGAYFHNNRKRTAGRTLQYIQLANGRTKVIRHETV